MSDINLDKSLDTELKQMQREQDILLHEPSVQAARDFLHKWNEGEGIGMSDDVIMAGIHKIRIVKGIGVKESEQWLTVRGYTLAPVFGEY